MDLAVAGLLDKEIGPQLGVSENTLRTYWTRIRAKLGQTSKAGLIATYVSVRAAAERSTEPVDPDWEIDLTTQIWRRRSDRPLPGLVDLPGEAPLDEIFRFVHPDDVPPMRDLIRSVADSDLSEFTFRARAVTPEGIQDISAFVVVVRAESGRPLKLLGRRSPVRDLRPTTIHDIEVGHWERDLRTLDFVGDAAFCRIFDVPEDSPNLRKAAFARFHPDELELTQNFVSDAVAEGKTWRRSTHRLLARDGGYRWIVTDMRIEYDAAGNAVRAFGTCMGFN